MSPRQLPRAHYTFLLGFMMTKETTASIFDKALKDLPEIIYAYIGGSFNTPFKTDSSDIDLILVWQEIPSLQIRNEIFDRLLMATQLERKWNFLDTKGPIIRDAIKIQNVPKIEIYYHTFAAFEYTLRNMRQKDGLAYSISRRLPLVFQPEIESFIDSYLPDRSTETQNLLFSIIADSQSNKANEYTFKNIIRLYSISKFQEVPAQKHWGQVIKKIPHHELLLDNHVSKWITQSLDLLLSWGRVTPDTRLSGTDNFTLEKHSLETAQHVFQRVTAQKERLAQFLSWPKNIQTLTDQEEFSKKAELQWSNGHAFHFQISDSKRFAGAISIHSLNYKERSFEFGYWVDHLAEGKGLISQGLQLLMKDMKKRGWIKAKIKTAQNNVKSKRVAERLGMAAETPFDRLLTYSITL